MYLSDDNSLEDSLSEKTDEELLALSVKKPGVFEVLLERYQAAFLRKSLTVVRGKEEAEDIVQETFAKIYLNAARFEKQEGASFKSWGYKILLNTSFTHYQRLKRRAGATAELDPEFYEMLPDVDSRSFEKQEVSDYLVSVFSRMPDHLARALHMHFVEGLPQKDIAKAENSSVSAVKTRIHRAKKEFRKIAETIST
jgi:RNA polymerase sigma-70 factor (ECF subfamily)|tara:strand:- start:28338 stop:28928 length:591 start_codon:yes stop_codon:yes gene_type:complete